MRTRIQYIPIVVIIGLIAITASAVITAQVNRAWERETVLALQERKAELAKQECQLLEQALKARVKILRDYIEIRMARKLAGMLPQEHAGNTQAVVTTAEVIEWL